MNNLVRLSRSALLHNLNEFQRFMPHVAPVVKSNAYGHGLKEVVEILKNEKVPFLVVDSLDEIRAIRSYGYTLPLVSVGYINPSHATEEDRRNSSFTMTSAEMLHQWVEHTGAPAQIHLKINTGMYRQGIDARRLPQALEVIHAAPHLTLEGMCTHLADADSSDTSFTDAQVAIWNTSVEIAQKLHPTLKYLHVSNTAGHTRIQDIVCNVSRLGIGLYGFEGNGKIDTMVSLKPALRITSIVSGLQEVPEGSRIGYNGTYQAPRPMRIAVVPIGYGGGIPRALSNSGVVQIRGQEAPIVGRVCMNIITVDVTDIPEVTFKDTVTLISDSVHDTNSVTRIARAIHTNPHEIATGISSLLPRIIDP